MRIIILSRGFHLYSTQSLLEAAKGRGHNVQVIDLTRLSFVISPGRAEILYEGSPLRRPDAVIPRIGTSVTQAGAAAIRQFEAMGICCLLGSGALLDSRDKLRCMQKLAAADIAVPKTILLGNEQDSLAAASALGGLPVILKLLNGTHGNGVLLVDNAVTLRSLMDMFQKQGERVIMQEFIAESRGADFRALVIGGKVVAAMKRQAEPGEFRSNLHRGAIPTPATLSPSEEALAVQASEHLNLEVSGVDILRSKNGPLIMEINASPGLEGIETCTGIDIAFQIIKHLEGMVYGK